MFVATTTGISAFSTLGMYNSELNRPYICFIIFYSITEDTIVRVGSLKENKTIFQQLEITIKSINHSGPCHSDGARNSITLVAVTPPAAANLHFSCCVNHQSNSTSLTIRFH